MITVRRLEGLPSLRVLNVYHSLMMGVKMLPSYLGETYEAFFARVEAMTPEDREKVIREAALLVKLEDEEVEALIGFCADANGVPFSKANIKSLSPDQIYEMIIAVTVECSKIKVNFVTAAEKKN